MKKVLSYDYPTRIFHWTFAVLFITIFSIAKIVDDESIVFSYHMILGIILAFAVLMRVLWGFLGSRYAKFNSFELHPKHLMEYFSTLLKGKTKFYAGHNPASSWAAIIMMILALGLAVTGMQMAQNNNKELFEEIHEILGNVFLVTAIAHVAGVVYHTISHKDMIGLSMIHGKKTTEEAVSDIPSKHPLAALTFIVLIIIFGARIASQFDPANRSLNFFGTTLHLGDDKEETEKSERQELEQTKDQKHDDTDNTEE